MLLHAADVGKQTALTRLCDGPLRNRPRNSGPFLQEGLLEYHVNRTIDPDQLNLAKLCRLMERYAGSLSETARLANGKQANRLNFKKVEQYDVISGLLDYAELGDAHAERLQALYKDCPVKPFGREISTKHLKELRAGLLD